jgi:hypothetical protein
VANPVSILILPPFRLSAMNLTPINLFTKSYFPIKEVVCFFLILDLFRRLKFNWLSLTPLFDSKSLPGCPVRSLMIFLRCP